jgi:uncharacterized glyoxalase superfamily protein PhnB
MKLHTYLNYGGNCEQAFRFYEQHLGGRIIMMMTQGQQPNAKDVPPDQINAILYARISLGETDLMGSDVPSERFQPMRSAYLSLSVNTIHEAERFLPCFPMVARSSCRCRRRFLRSALRCYAISSELPGWSSTSELLHRTLSKRVRYGSHYR